LQEGLHILFGLDHEESVLQRDHAVSVPLEVVEHLAISIEHIAHVPYFIRVIQNGHAGQGDLGQVAAGGEHPKPFLWTKRDNNIIRHQNSIPFLYILPDFAVNRIHCYGNGPPIRLEGQKIGHHVGGGAAQVFAIGVKLLQIGAVQVGADNLHVKALNTFHGQIGWHKLGEGRVN